MCLLVSIYIEAETQTLHDLQESINSYQERQNYDSRNLWVAVQELSLTYQNMDI